MSNQALCGKGASDSNIGYYYRIVFPVGEEATYSFKTPTDFGNGGFSVLDGDFKAFDATDIT